jgi:hypothetical protein
VLGAPQAAAAEAATAAACRSNFIKDSSSTLPAYPKHSGFGANMQSAHAPHSWPSTLQVQGCSFPAPGVLDCGVTSHP